MALYNTNKCLLTLREVTSIESEFDGYHYRLTFKGINHEIKLSPYENWRENEWVQTHGEEFFNLIEETNSWSFFRVGRKLDDVTKKYIELKNKFK